MLVQSKPPTKAHPIWEFALAWYGQSGVEADCLVAQDIYGLDITAIIFALYRAADNQGFDTGMAVELARTLSARIVDPLRSVRVALKTLPNLVDQTVSEALRQRVKAAELDAERMTLITLTNLEVKGEAVSFEAALIATALASQAGNDAELGALLKRLALAAQNM